MSWEYFILFAVVALVCWSLGAFAAWKGKKTVWAYGFTLLGLAVFFCFILGMWVSLERPPMRTTCTGRRKDGDTGNSDEGIYRCR